MKRKTLVLALLVGCMFGWASGCRQDKAPEARQARLIAAESMQLRKQLAERDAEIEEIEARHTKEIEQRQEQLAACQKRITVLQRDLEQGVARRVDSVMAAVMAENARLRKEVETLRAEIQTLKAQRPVQP
jgi:chromosome segregation ATPase